MASDDRGDLRSHGLARQRSPVCACSASSASGQGLGVGVGCNVGECYRLIRPAGPMPWRRGRCRGTVEAYPCGPEPLRLAPGLRGPGLPGDYLGAGVSLWSCRLPCHGRGRGNRIGGSSVSRSLSSPTLPPQTDRRNPYPSSPPRPPTGEGSARGDRARGPRGGAKNRARHQVPTERETHTHTPPRPRSSRVRGATGVLALGSRCEQVTQDPPPPRPGLPRPLPPPLDALVPRTTPQNAL